MQTAGMNFQTRSSKVYNYAPSISS
ncbi:hypothetical protein [Enterocloster hominis (ex Hitch et al. 2024)]|nr:hypothetical protein [Lachnoclostridium pacaense]